MFLKPRVIAAILMLYSMLSLPACASISGLLATPTIPPPTSTPVPPTPTPPPLAALVNGEYITQTEFEAELARFRAAQPAADETIPEQQAETIVLDDLVAQVLLAQGARAEGFELSESELQSRMQSLAEAAGGDAALAEWISSHGYTAETFRLALKRSVEAAWMRDKIVADVPLATEQVHLQQILSYNEEDAVQALARLDGGTDFDELAGSQFYDPTTRGELGWVPRGYLLDPNLDAAAFSLEVGAYSQVIETPAGFHIIKVLERDPQHELSPDALLRLQELAVQAWIDEQRAQGDIELTP